MSAHFQDRSCMFERKWGLNQLLHLIHPIAPRVLCALLLVSYESRGFLSSPLSTLLK